MFKHQSNQFLHRLAGFVGPIALGIVVLALAGCSSQQVTEPVVAAAKQAEAPMTNVKDEQPVIAPSEADDQAVTEPVSYSPLAVTKTENIVYARQTIPLPHEWTLDEYTPAEPGDWPIVLFVAGQGGHKGGRPELMQALAEQGATVFDVGYPDMGPEAALEGNGRGYRDMTETVGCALRFAHARALTLGNDRPFITIVGFSLGGGIGSYLALVEDNLERRWETYAASNGGRPSSQVECEANESIQVDALVGIGGYYDAFIGSDGELGREAWLKAQDSDLWQMFHTAIGENPDLKIRLLRGKFDISYDKAEVSVTLETILTEAGYDVDLIQFPAGHQIPFELTVQTVTGVTRE